MLYVYNYCPVQQVFFVRPDVGLGYAVHRTRIALGALRSQAEAWFNLTIPYVSYGPLDQAVESLVGSPDTVDLVVVNRAARGSIVVLTRGNSFTKVFVADSAVDGGRVGTMIADQRRRVLSIGSSLPVAAVRMVCNRGPRYLVTRASEDAQVVDLVEGPLEQAGVDLLEPRSARC